VFVLNLVCVKNSSVESEGEREAEKQRGRTEVKER
jgi:hypothetical protein